MRFSVISPNLSGCCSVLDIGVTALVTYLNERTPHEANVLDFTFKTKIWKRYLLDQLEAFKPDVVGITTTSLFMRYVRETIEEIRREYSTTIPIILGGYHTTLNPEDTINEDGVTGIVIGEGEFVVEEYLDALEQNRSLEDIPGLWYRRPDKTIIRNARRPWIEDIDSLPFPNYDLWEDIDKYFYFTGQLWFMGTRGCPYKCTNCSEEPMNRAVPGKRFRVRDPKGYVTEIRHQWDKYRDRGLRMAHPFDAVFTAQGPWVREFCEEYKRQGLARELPFSVFSHGATSQDEKVRCLAEAGCKEIRIGIESGNEKIRNVIYNKRATNNQLRQAFRSCKKYGVNTIAYNMLGGPTETKENLHETFAFNKELDPNKPIFFVFRPLPGTDVIAQCEVLGEEIDVAAMSHSIDTLHWGSVLKSKHRPRRYVELFQMRCFAHFVPLRMARLLKKQGASFFSNMARYMAEGKKHNLDMRIVFAYFLASCGDNLFL